MAKTKKEAAPEPTADELLLKSAEEFCKGKRTGAEFFSAFFSPDGQVAKLYPEPEARTLFASTQAYERLKELMAQCYGRRRGKDSKRPSAQMVTVRMSAEMHESLLAAARAAGVSLNSFCLQRLSGAILDASLK